MRRTTYSNTVGAHRDIIVLLALLMAPAISAQTEEGSTLRRTLSGIVVNAAGEPVAGVEYWIEQFHPDDGGRLFYTGDRTIGVTDRAGRFSCGYGGMGRREVAISVAFFHSKYAPTWAIKKRYDENPVTVQLDPGVELKGIAAVNGHRADGYLFQWPLHLRLDCVNSNIGGWDTRIEAQTDAKGRFTFRIPTDYWTCNYSLYFAGHKLPMKLQSGKPLPFIELRNTVEMDLKPLESQATDDRGPSLTVLLPAQEDLPAGTTSKEIPGDVGFPFPLKQNPTVFQDPEFIASYWELMSGNKTDAQHITEALYSCYNEEAELGVCAFLFIDAKTAEDAEKLLPDGEQYHHMLNGKTLVLIWDDGVSAHVVSFFKRHVTNRLGQK